MATSSSLISATEIFVYYRLRAADTAAALAAFQALRAELAAEGHAVEALRVMQRQDSDISLPTWMEIYGPGLADPLALEARVAVVMAPFVQGLRHRELFTAL